MSIGNYLEKLKEWSCHEKYSILYNAENEELSARLINSKIQGKSNLYFIIEDINGNLFGSYHTFIPSEKERKVNVTEDPKHFIFTLKNPFNIQPSLFTPKESNDHIISFYHDYDIRNVLNVQYCYGIVAQNKVFLYENIIRHYNDVPSDCGCRLLTGTANTFVDIAQFFIIQMI